MSSGVFLLRFLVQGRVPQRQHTNIGAEQRTGRQTFFVVKLSRGKVLGVPHELEKTLGISNLHRPRSTHHDGLKIL